MRFLGALWVSACATGFTCAAAGPDTNAIPPLRPPRPELPPGFWESNSSWVIGLAVLFLAAIGLLTWWWRRSRPAVVVPPAVQARAALAPLRNQPETGAVLSQVSQVVRRYVRGAFGLPDEEMTTTDLGRAIGGREDIGAPLSGSILQFLRTCDERKFAPGQSGPPLGAVEKAEGLIATVEEERAEQERARLAQAAAGSAGERPPGEGTPA